jgi:hypothetical protein
MNRATRILLPIGIMAAIVIVAHGIQCRHEQKKTEAANQIAQKAELEAKNKADREAAAIKSAQDKADTEAAAAKAVQDAVVAHQRFLTKYVNTGIAKQAGNQMVAVAVASENSSMNHAVGVALVNRFKSDHVQLTDSFFKPEMVTGGLFDQAFTGATDLFNQLELAKSLDALLLARQNVQYETNADLSNVIYAHMSLEITTLPVTGQIQSQSWTFTANGTGFRLGEARQQAEERLINQITSDTKMSLGF